MERRYDNVNVKLLKPSNNPERTIPISSVQTASGQRCG